METTIRRDDTVVCRINGTSECYVIGTVVSGEVGALSLRALSTMVGRRSALWLAYRERKRDSRVWLFDGAAAAYVETVAPVARDGHGAAADD